MSNPSVTQQDADLILARALPPATTTRRMVYATIANAVLAGLPEPQEMTFDPATVWLRFDNTDDARLWARWHSPECLASFYTGGTNDAPLHCYYGERSDWKWSIVGRDQGRSTLIDGNDRPTVEQVTIAALAPDSLIVPCPRCGHDEHHHEDDDPGTARCCLDCGGFCSPKVLVPAHVDGWAIDGRTGK